MLKVGSTEQIAGDVTTLNWIGPRPPAVVERALGFQPGRLAAGYVVLLLKEALRPEDFEFAGTTLRSGGRLGAPAATAAADAHRPRVHDRIGMERGIAGYKALQMQVLKSVAIFGPQRIAKVIAVTPHRPDLAPDLQYPPGGGGLQWTLVRKKRFLVALAVRPDGEAVTPAFTVSLADGQPGVRLYENRARIAQYLAAA
jgi:hypothetical protein